MISARDSDASNHGAREITMSISFVLLVAKVERFTVHTAKYMLNTRGRQRGRGKVELDEVGEGPVDVVLDVVVRVQSRTGDGEPPVEIDPELWFAQEEDDESTTQA